MGLGLSVGIGEEGERGREGRQAGEESCVGGGPTQRQHSCAPGPSRSTSCGQAGAAASPEMRVMMKDHRVSHVWQERNQKREEEMSRKSSRMRAAWRGRSKTRPRSTPGTPRACRRAGRGAGGPGGKPHGAGRTAGGTQRTQQSFEFEARWWRWRNSRRREAAAAGEGSCCQSRLQ